MDALSDRSMLNAQSGGHAAHLARPAKRGPNLAFDYAGTLLADLCLDAASLSDRAQEHPAIAWASSGAMMLTGHPNGPSRVCPVPLASCADGALMAFASLSEQPLPPGLKGALLLGERAAIAGYGRAGSVSPGGSCRFLETSDGWLALNLARPADWEMLPALVEQDIAPEWPALAEALRVIPTDALIARGRELGLAIAKHGFEARTRPWFGIDRQGANAGLRYGAAPLVVELASLWAGPLCGHLLHLAGARVIKVESAGRPDGARFGPLGFHDLLNAGKESVALDFSTSAGRDALRALIARADIMIDASRPRALGQLGISGEEIVAASPGLTWLSITGYGRTGDEANWVAFGDDAGVSAGLSALIDRSDGPPIFCGDAIADPLTGIHAALVALAHFRRGAGGLVSLALRDVVGHCIAFDGPCSLDEAADREREWQEFLERRAIVPASPRARAPSGKARPLGADTAAVLRELKIAC
jgi:hypothetical protein